MSRYAELQVTSNYSFLRGASHVEELMAQARLLGLPAIGITDRNTLAGIARAHQRAEEAGLRLVVGCRLDRDCRKFWGHAATATGGCRSLAGRNLCPKSEPRVPL